MLITGGDIVFKLAGLQVQDIQTAGEGPDPEPVIIQQQGVYIVVREAILPGLVFIACKSLILRVKIVEATVFSANPEVTVCILTKLADCFAADGVDKLRRSVMLKRIIFR